MHSNPVLYMVKLCALLQNVMFIDVLVISSYFLILHSGNTARIFKRMCSFNKNKTQVIYCLVKELQVIGIKQIINVVKKREGIR